MASDTSAAAAISGMVTSRPVRISSAAARTIASWVRFFWLTRPEPACCGVPAAVIVASSVTEKWWMFMQSQL